MKKKLLDCLGKLKGNSVCGRLAIISVIVIVALYCFNFIDTEEQITLTSIGSGLIAIIGLYFFYKRLKNQDIQRVDDRFNSAINLLGSSETSARTGAVYVLHELALEEDKYRQQIVQILCSHVRSKTSELSIKKLTKNAHQMKFKLPSIFYLKRKCGLYTQDFAKVSGFPRRICQHAYLVRADFRMHSVKGRFLGCTVSRANFMMPVQGDFLIHSVKGRIFGAQCQGANFLDAQCQGAIFGMHSVKGRFFGSTVSRGEF
ncbi:hypothetical protein BSPWISOXPB_8627 [uncultured Gammaproteobacteria bacterium]|nr:hypothetical protein BSPWISOXPB_8627 [uncultured Gammaproteobacteria bacterium]